MTERRSYRALALLIVAKFQEGPRTWQSVVSDLKMGNVSAELWLSEYREAGMLRICGYEPRQDGVSAGRRKRIFELQKPFERADEPYPHIEPPRKRKEPRAELVRCVSKPEPSAPSWDFEAGRDLASAWRGQRVAA